MKQFITRKTVFGLLLVVIVVALGLWLLNIRTNNTVTSNTSKTAGAIPKIAVVDITKSGFVPSTLSISVDTRVIWVNEDVAPHLPAADPYPTHSQLPSLVAPRALGQKETYSFLFTKAGTVQYHDDLNPTLTGTIVIK